MAMDRIEVITSVERRRRWSAAEKARLVAAMNEPGAVVTEIARSAGVDASLLYRWRRQFAAERETAAFVPVRVSPDLNEAVSTTAPVCAPPSAPSSSITIAFGEQVRMTIEGAPDCSDFGEGDRRADGAGSVAMIAFPSGARVWLATGHTDMRKGFGSLALMVQEGFKRDPHAGDLWVFRGRRGDLIKLIWHDGDGACLFVKRLERGRFLWPSVADGVVTISAAQLSYLLSGIDWRMPQKTWRPKAAG